MKVHQCDNCKSVVKENTLLVIGRDIYHNTIDLCPVCAESIVDGIMEAAINTSLKRKLNLLPQEQET